MEGPRPLYRGALEFLSGSLEDLRDRRRVVALVVAAAAAVPLAVLLLSDGLGVPVTDLIRDPTQVTGIHPAVGLLSNAGLMGWSAAVVLCLFVVVSLPPEGARRSDRAFFLWSAAFSAALLLDDAFLLHEGYWPIPLHEGVYYAAYAMVALLYVRVLARRPAPGSRGFLLLAFAGFALSLALDVSFVIERVRAFESPITFLEDTFKFVGIVFWVTFLADVGRRTLREAYGDA